MTSPGPQVPEPEHERAQAITEGSRAALGVLGGAGERGAFVPPTEYVMRGGTAIQASGGEFSPSEARDLAHVVLEAMPELFDRAALAGGPDEEAGYVAPSGRPGACGPCPDVDALREADEALLLIADDASEDVGTRIDAVRAMLKDLASGVSVVREGDRQETKGENDGD